jgi:hypothetical protein
MFMNCEDKERALKKDELVFPYKPALRKYSLTQCKMDKGFTVFVLGTKNVWL